MESGEILHMEGISKSFGAVQALKEVDFILRPGEVHALLGENGAGKTTLMKVLCGIHEPDAGRVYLKTTEVRLRTPRQASEAGVAMIHQELNLVGDLDVAANIFLGREPRRGRWFLNRSELRAQASVVLERLGVTLDTEALVSSLRVGQCQCVEIARALSCDARILVMDEPTSALSQAEVQALFALIRTLKSQGVGVVYISHRLDEVFAVADRVTVLRDGGNVLSAPVAELNEKAVVEAMVGHPTDLGPAKKTRLPGPTVLEVNNLFLAGTEKGSRDLLVDVSFLLRAGEVLGLAGLLGAGRTELLESLFGVFRRRVTGKVKVRGRPARLRSVRGAMAQGLALLPEDRNRLGLIRDRDLRENLFLAASRSRGGLLDRGRERAAFRARVAELGIRASGWNAGILELSGGNQQKVLLGRWLERDPAILLLDEPTRGIDVGAKEEIYRLIERLASAGMAIIVATSELPELVRLADRILVLRAGRLVAEVPRGEAREDRLLHLMAGKGQAA